MCRGAILAQDWAGILLDMKRPLIAALLALLPFMSVTLATFMERVADQISAIP